MQDDQRFRSLYQAIFAMGNNFLRQGKYDKALIIFDGLIALAPKERIAHIAYGEALLKANRAEKAIKHLLSFTRHFSADGRTLILTAKARILLGNTDEARKLLTMVVAKEILVTVEDERIASTMLTLLEI